MNSPASPSLAHIGQRLTLKLHTAVEYLLLRRIFSVEIAIFGLGMLAGAYLIFTIWLYQAPPLAPKTTSGPTQLSTEKIDTLELWIEERHQELQTPLNLSRTDYFAEKVSP